MLKFWMFYQILKTNYAKFVIKYLQIFFPVVGISFILDAFTNGLKMHKLIKKLTKIGLSKINFYFFSSKQRKIKINKT